MPGELDILEALLKRQCADAEERDAINLRENELDCYFYFDRIEDADDLEKAWALFPDHREIRRRLHQVEEAANIVPGFGYRVPKAENRCTPAVLADLVRSLVERVGPLILREDYNQNELDFLSAPFEIALAPPDVPVPPAEKNGLFGALYEGIQEFARAQFPREPEHYDVLHHWAIYLTKCDEVAFYLLWPCFRNLGDISPHTPEPWFRLWTFRCRDRFWIKDGESASGVLYFRPPWFDGTP